MKDRRRGALLGLAIGDALGAAVEFRAPGSFKLVTGYRDGGPHGLASGEWTDDTSMALALADSIANVGWELNDQADRYLEWWQHGRYSVTGRCFDIGNATRGSLRIYERSRDARTSGDPGEYASGNGSIMRLAPVPIRYAHLFPNDLAQLALLGEESSLPTHGSAQCRSACRYMTIVLAALMHGEPRERVLAPDWEPLTRLIELAPLEPKIEAVVRIGFRTKQPPEIRGTGWVVESLEAALWAFHTADSFESAVLKAVNLGDDADTTGAICGQFAGAYWGESQIPKPLLDGLARRDMLEAALSGLIGESGEKSA